VRLTSLGNRLVMRDGLAIIRQTVVGDRERGITTG